MSEVFAMWRVTAGAAVGGTMLAGCAGPKPLYQWGDYQPQVYQYLKDEAKEAQVAELERGLEKIKAANGAMSPGYHVQLDMLYSGLGKDDQTVQEFNTERTLFPGSTTYIDLLMESARRGTN